MITRRMLPNALLEGNKIPNDGNTYLYYLGNECISNSGGWGYFWHRNDYTNGVFAKLDDCIYFGDNSPSYGNPMPFCLNFINFTKYSKIGIDYEISYIKSNPTYEAFLHLQFYSVMPVQGAGDNYGTPIEQIVLYSLKSSTASSKPRNIEIYDVSSYNSTLSLVLYDFSHASGSHQVINKLYKLWLEP